MEEMALLKHRNNARSLNTEALREAITIILVVLIANAIPILFKQKAKKSNSDKKDVKNDLQHNGNVRENQDSPEKILRLLSSMTTSNLQSTSPSMKATERNADLERLIFFSDGVFAIAITLLMLNIHLPPPLERHDMTTDLINLLQNDILIYAYSFLVIGFFWNAHRQIFRYIKRGNGILISLNILFLLCIAFIPFPSSVLEFDKYQAAVIFYDGSMALTGFMLCVLWFYVLSEPRLLKEKPTSDVIRHHNILVLLPTIMFLISIGITFIPRIHFIPSFDVLDIWYFVPYGPDFAKLFWIVIPIALIMNYIIYNRKVSGYVEVE